MEESQQEVRGKESPLTGPAESPTAQEAADIAVEGYIYAYPLVIMDISRRLMTNFEAPFANPQGAGGPTNQFVHVGAFPDAKFTDVVRPNADTLYSFMWFDVSNEPLVVRVPDSGGRYYLLPMLDMWTDVFASPGKRTTGTGEQTFAILGPAWSGKVPDDVDVIRAPTNGGWLIGRTQTDGTADYDRVHEFQSGIAVTPLSAWGKYYEPPRGKVDPKLSKVPPVEQIAKMDGATFFDRFTQLLRTNAPHANDYPILQRLARIGIAPGRPFDFATATSEVRNALNAAPAVALPKIVNYIKRSSPVVNGWEMLMSPVGTYGTDYLKRAMVAFAGLGANVVEDAIYPTGFTDSEGRPFDSGHKYVMHFERKQVPPVRAFWSLTMYNDKQFFADNPINRYAIGDRDNLKFNNNGSLDLYIQRASPGDEKKRNWLPAPASGGFSMNLRLYWPKLEALGGDWAPPPVKRIE
jgi:hypothetical protein